MIYSEIMPMMLLIATNPPILPAIITATAGLFGVLIGSMITRKREEKKEFYIPIYTPVIQFLDVYMSFDKSNFPLNAKKETMKKLVCQIRESTKYTPNNLEILQLLTGVFQFDVRDDVKGTVKQKNLIMFCEKYLEVFEQKMFRYKKYFYQNNEMLYMIRKCRYKCSVWVFLDEISVDGIDPDEVVQYLWFSQRKVSIREIKNVINLRKEYDAKIKGNSKYGCRKEFLIIKLESLEGILKQTQNALSVDGHDAFKERINQGVNNLKNELNVNCN
ncbi:hypothetical protein CN581_14495 [Bacillus toyonensis]|uniref:hypothetical protein n=1 Tax=Bacillus toyonensis TaxID=155322 RepID=UPI000BF99070|nr:hypothetical protein [Bacillus toyonensis]PEP80700.1 hypothetical protein CN581_14495 [Bacillus toyonensis]